MTEPASRIRAAIRRLEEHFDRVVVSPPATDALRSSLAERLPAGADELDTFYSIANGIRVGMSDVEVGHIHSLEESLEAHAIGLAHTEGDAEGDAMLLPIREDGCGNFDCVVLGAEAASGSVVFWDHEIHGRPAYLLGSSLASYLEMWSDHLVHQYLPSGDIHPRAEPPELDRWPWLGTPEREHPWPFDTVWMTQRDPSLADLLQSPFVRRWLAEQEG